ncbi:ABC transporter permease [Candidatus Clostridium stratigraminis]|uniref:ABC transporter permease n=1 Tax=Candidatus Clostridium stratigraminis TaxID=3381661 RepID=A0ABW8T6H7_9CLOT
MNFVENFKMALESIKANKLRSFLTMLGIIIGISSVITIESLGAGGKNSINTQFEKLGAATVNIGIDPTEAQIEDYFTFEDVKQIKSKVDAVKYASITSTKRGQVASASTSKMAILLGGNSDVSSINNYDITYGRFFNDKEVDESKNVVVVDDNTAKALFGYEDVVGKTIKIGTLNANKTVTIIGVRSSGNMFAANPNAPSFIDVPITVLKEMYSGDFTMDTISLMASSKDAGEAAGNGAKNILESRHNNRGKDVYTVTSLLQSLDQVNNALSIFTTFISAVAAISLVVGGIGVMNIMLVSVTERTREIGLRKAIGATTKTILFQFLTESVIVSLIGGLIGMILGISLAQLIGYFVNIVPSLSITAILGAILFSSAVGIFFGIYPARKAAQLNPIDALRYE